MIAPRENFGMYKSAHDPESAFAQALEKRALGQGGPGFAATQLQQQTGQAKQGLASQLAGSRSLAPGQARHMQNLGQALMDQRAASQMNELNMQEQLANQQGWQNWNQDADAYEQGMQGLASQHSTAQNQLELERAIAGAQRKETSHGAFMSGIGSAMSLLSMSDRNAKKDIGRLSDKDQKSFLEALKGYRYRYKQDAKPDGNRRHAGIMVQDLEKSDMGKRLVNVAPDSSGKPRKQYDTGEAMGAALASLGYLHKRLKKLEGK